MDKIIGMRLSGELLLRIDALRNGPTEWMKTTRSEVIRAALEVGLGHLEKQSAKASKGKKG